MKLLKNLHGYILLALFFLLPLFFLPVTVDAFNINKLALLVLLSLFSLLFWTLGKIKDRNFLGVFVGMRANPFDLPVFALMIVFLLSSFLATVNKVNAFVFPGTTSVLVSAALVYYLLNQFLGDKEDKNFSSNYNLAVSSLTGGAVIVSLVTLLSGLQVFSLLGKVLPLPSFLTQSYFSPTGDTISSLLLFIVALPLLFGRVLSIVHSNSEKSIWSIGAKSLTQIASFIILAAGTGMTLFLALPGKVAAVKILPFQFGWSIALETLKNQPFFGIGSGNFLEAFNRFRPVEYNTGKLWNVGFVSSSNFYLHIFTVAGLLGLLTVLWLILKIFQYLFKKASGVNLVDFKMARVAMFLLLIVFLFVPPTLLGIVLFFFVLSLMGTPFGHEVRLELSRLGLSESNNDKQHGLNMISLFLAFTIFVFMLSVFYFGGRVYLAEVHYENALMVISKGGTYKEVMDGLARAMQADPYVEKYRTDYARISLNLVGQIAKKKDISDTDRKDISNLVQVAIAQGKAAVTIDQNLSANWATLADIYRLVMPIAKGSDQWAITSYQQALSLEPTNPNLWISLGGVYYANANYDDAVSIFQRATDAKPDLANAHYNLAIALREAGKLDRALSEMNQTLTLLSSSTDDYKTVQQAISSLQDELNKKKTEEQKTSGSGQNVQSGTQGSQIEEPKKVQPIVNPPVELPKGSAPPATGSGEVKK